MLKNANKNAVYGRFEPRQAHHLPRATTVSMPTANKRGIAAKPATGGLFAYMPRFSAKASLHLHSPFLPRFRPRKGVSVSEVKVAYLHSPPSLEPLFWRGVASG